MMDADVLSGPLVHKVLVVTRVIIKIKLYYGFILYLVNKCIQVPFRSSKICTHC